MSLTTEGCMHRSDQQVRTVYYVQCSACGDLLLVSTCNYSVDCHPSCALAPICIQGARQRYHAQVPLAVPRDLLEAARAREEARDPRH
jgi:hypothetical protein